MSRVGIYICGEECQAIEPGAQVLWSADLARDGRGDLCPYCGAPGMLLRAVRRDGHPIDLICSAVTG